MNPPIPASGRFVAPATPARSHGYDDLHEVPHRAAALEREWVPIILTRRTGSGGPLLDRVSRRDRRRYAVPGREWLDVAGPVYVLKAREETHRRARPELPAVTEINSVDQVLKLIAADEGTEPGPFVWSFRRLVVLEAAAQRHSRGTSEPPPIPARSSPTSAAYGAGRYRLAVNFQRFSATTTNIPNCHGLHARCDT
ncbi:hypothetical protein GCM10010280_11460 [Streptomyces pilosus]|uniref:Uncharacterized protein n=1 Tax=Streptomyces pilosus TaxID=28893 RepID=A0A918ESX5_9ACTN|nr:hypothetical protein GCM10010280_11460 [Streptomyces pilosus]